MKYKPQVANTRLFNFAVLTKLVILHFVDDFMNFNYRKTTISVMPSKNTTNTVTPTCIPVLNTVMDTKSRVSSQFQEMSHFFGYRFIFRELRAVPTSRKVSVPFSQPIGVDFGTCTKWSSPQGLI